MKDPISAIDPMDPVNQGIPLWAVYGTSIYWPQILCCRIRINEGAGYVHSPHIWGYSVWKRQPGFRTLGIPVKDFSERNAFCYFFASQAAMLEYVETITTPKAGV